MKIQIFQYILILSSLSLSLSVNQGQRIKTQVKSTNSVGWLTKH